MNISDESPKVTLVADNGVAVDFDIAATVEHEGRYYALLTPAEPDETIEDEPQFFLMHVDEVEGGYQFSQVIDEALTLAVMNKIMDMIDSSADNPPAF